MSSRPSRCGWRPASHPAAQQADALDLAVTALKRSGLRAETGHLASLGETILALVPRSRVAKLESDHQAQGLLPAPHALPLTWGNQEPAAQDCLVRHSFGPAPTRRRQTRRRHGRSRSPLPLRGNHLCRHNRHIVRASAGFQPSGVRGPRLWPFQNEEEYGEVVWRFAPAAAKHAREFEFTHNRPCRTRQTAR
jgi:hypothetical protein